MPSTSCSCGFEIAGDGRDAQVASGLAHFTEAHPQMQMPEAQIRNDCERVEQLSGPTERLDSIGEVEVLPITADRIDDVLAFFDSDAFADNPAGRRAPACATTSTRRRGRAARGSRTGPTCPSSSAPGASPGRWPTSTAGSPPG